MWDKHMPHTLYKFFSKSLWFYKKLFFDFGYNLILIQREPQKTNWEADFEIKDEQSVRF